ncbi:chromatin assembly factor 1 subunit A-domain-containing protein [Mycena capillaripes]|nr:chromatin assembly factor 1 subunit A-domain-containing protein [Mycena capillaripes]
MQPPSSAAPDCDMNTAAKPAVPTDSNGGAPEKSSITDLKNGKVVFKQKPISFEKHSETLQEIVKFREMLEERIARQADGLSVIPEEYKPVIAKLAHESDKTLSALSKHILQELLPVQDEDDEKSLPPPLTLHVVENGIKSVANRNNYGLDGMPGVKAPAAVCVWRWEAKSAHLDWLPRNAREKADSRMAERVQAKLDLKAIFDALPKDEQDSILDPKGTAAGKVSTKDGATGSGFNTIDLTGDDMKSSPQPSKKKKENEENDSASAPKVGRPKKIADSDKTAKEKEKQEKKAAKTEREQKEQDAQNKSRSILQSFLKAGKTSRAMPPKEPESDGNTSSSNISQFHKTFRPFVVKKDTTLAPVNWFTSQNTKPLPPLTYDGDVIVVDDADDSQPSVQTDVTGMSAKDRLRSTLQTLPPALRPRARTASRTHDRASAAQMKISNSVSVRDMVGRLNEAEVTGDDNLVRSILTQLSDRDVVPAKVFIFADDARPGYFGTWTRDSRIIGPRTPFARDVAVFDYGYDSGEEWEEEPTGDADDIIDDGEDEDGEPDDADSDLDSWLVDDDEEPHTPAEDRGGSPVFSTLQAPAKRKAETEDAKLTKKRKVVVPLVPFAKGPSWEQTIGRCEHNLFTPYRIQLFNDTPFPIDPFTFVSQCNDVTRASKKDGFAVPSLPDRIVVASPARLDLPAAPPAATVPKRAAIAPKTVFPEIHLAQLLAKITSSPTASLPILVDTIYQDLKVHKVKKNSVEAKVREVAEKCKVKKVWIVKDNFQVAATGA